MCFAPPQRANLIQSVDTFFVTRETQEDPTCHSDIGYLAGLMSPYDLVYVLGPMGVDSSVSLE